jgi:hypothetical protein
MSKSAAGSVATPANCQFRTGITRIREGALRFRIALLYAEKEPIEEKN